MSQPEPDENDLDSQYRRPFGEVGRRVGEAMARDHLPENLWTVAQLNPQPSDSILEVGFGPGTALSELLKTLTHGSVAGIDFSETMVTLARERNASAIGEDRADLRYGEATHLPFEDTAFDKAFSIHSIYFWPRPLLALKEFYRVLKPGGLLVLTILPKEKWPRNVPGAPLDCGTPECTPYFAYELQAMLEEAGFSTTHIAFDPAFQNANPSNFSILATK